MLRYKAFTSPEMHGFRLSLGMTRWCGQTMVGQVMGETDRIVWVGVEIRKGYAIGIPFSYWLVLVEDGLVVMPVVVFFLVVFL